MKQMVVASSKGSFIKISVRLCSRLSVEGRRIPFRFRHCTLPHLTKDDYSVFLWAQRSVTVVFWNDSIGRRRLNGP